MVKVTIVNNSEKVYDFAGEGDTLSSMLEKHNIDPCRGTVSFDFAPITPAQLSQPIETLAKGETCYITNIVKADGGLR